VVGASVIAVAPDGTYTVDGTTAGGAWVAQMRLFKWHIVTLKPSQVGAVAVRPDSRRVAAGHGKKVTLFTPFDREGPLVELTGHTAAVRAVAFAPDGATLVSGGTDGLVIFWDPATGSERRRLDPGIGALAALAFAPDGLTLAVGGRGGLAILDVS
jgi:WD40 repeat protein